MEGDPYFGKLPAELLTKIAVMLPLDEAARTSVLSRRWRSQWRTPGLPNRHFAGSPTTKFTPEGYPISCFGTVDEFLTWVDQVIRRREPFPLRRPTRTNPRIRRTEFSIESLGLNFDPEEDPRYYHGWIEFNKDRSKTSAPLVDGACTCCRFKAVSFLSRPPPHGIISLSNLLRGRRRQELLKRLTLRNCDMETLRSQFTWTGRFLSLRSLVVQKGRLIEGRFLFNLIYHCPYLRELTLEDCSIIDDFIYGRNPDIQPCAGGRLLIISESLVLLRLTRCSGFEEVTYSLGRLLRRYDYPPTTHQETVEFDFLSDPTPRQTEPDPDDVMMAPAGVDKSGVEDDGEDEIDMPEEDQIACNFYHRFECY